MTAASSPRVQSWSRTRWTWLRCAKASSSAILAEPNTRVRKGQLLARLDDRQISADLDAASAKTRSIQANLKNWEAETKVLESDLTRAQKLWEAGVFTKETLEHAQYKVEADKFEISRETELLTNAQATERSLELEKEKTRIIAPFDGIVARRYVRVGQKVGISDRLFWVTAVSPLEVKFTLPERFLGKVKNGQTVTVELADGSSAVHHTAAVTPDQPGGRSLERNHRSRGPAPGPGPRPAGPECSPPSASTNPEMNILEALEVALPDLPAQTAQRRYPQARSSRDLPGTHRARRVASCWRKCREPRSTSGSRPEQWQLLQLFDGERSYKQISDLILQQANVAFTEDDVREFASFLEEQGELFYKTPLEKNITLRQKMSSERQKRGRFHVADVTDITLHTWPYADDYLTTIQPYFEFVYTTWFTLLTLVHVRRHGVDVGRQIRRNLERQFCLLQFHREDHLGPGGILVSVRRHGFLSRDCPRPDLQALRRPGREDAVPPDVFRSHFHLRLHPGLDCGRQEGAHFNHHCRHLGRPHDLRGAQPSSGGARPPACSSTTLLTKS